MTTVAGTGYYGSNDGIGTSAGFAFNNYNAIAVNRVGRIALIPDYSNAVVRRLDLESHVVTTFVGSTRRSFSVVDGYGTSISFAGPTGIALDGATTFALVVSQFGCV